MLKSFLILIVACFSLLCVAQKAAEVSRKSPDYRQIIAVLTPMVRKQAAGPIRLTGDMVRRAGDWVFVRSGIKFINPKMQGDGEAMALLRKKGKKWQVLEEEVGSGGMEDLADEWVKKYHTPRGLIPRM